MPSDKDITKTLTLVTNIAIWQWHTINLP